MRYAMLHELNADALHMIRAGLSARRAPEPERTLAGPVGHVPASVDVRALRRRLKLSQKAFAARYGFTVRRIQDWEQRRSRPDSGARAYLTVIANDPDAVELALEAN